MLITKNLRSIGFQFALPNLNRFAVHLACWKKKKDYCTINKKYNQRDDFVNWDEIEKIKEWKNYK